MNKRIFTTEATEEHGVFELKIVKFLRETPSCPQDSSTPWFIFLLDIPF
jgi:hypothetical protein